MDRRNDICILCKKNVYSKIRNTDQKGTIQCSVIISKTGKTRKSYNTATAQPSSDPLLSAFHKAANFYQSLHLENFKPFIECGNHRL